jgi:hypothetical protein
MDHGVRGFDGDRNMPERCWTTGWVVDLNTGKFFNTVCWDLIMDAVEANTDLLSGLYAASLRPAPPGPAFTCRDDG